MNWVLIFCFALWATVLLVMSVFYDSGAKAEVDLMVSLYFFLISYYCFLFFYCTQVSVHFFVFFFFSYK